jgi:hypothetical protein
LTYSDFNFRASLECKSKHMFWVDITCLCESGSLNYAATRSN